MKDQRRPKSDKEDAQRPKEGIKMHINAYILNCFFAMISTFPLRWWPAVSKCDQSGYLFKFVTIFVQVEQK
jgi:hypothetical protein